jgi:ATP-dependent RNA helicase RhlE
MTANDFNSLGLSEPLLRALAAREYTTPTPIQTRAIPHLLAGRDLLGIAQTGTGKTAAFALPMLQLLTAANRRPRPRMPRALVLAPTRELATQIADSFTGYGKFLHQTVTIVFGGVGQMPQVNALKRGVDILVATPGRLLDLMQQRHCDLSDVEILVLDEADRMLDMGFLPDVKRILATLSRDRQSLLFSATMPNDITALAARFLRDPLRVEVTPPAATADRIDQGIYFVSKAKKRDLLVSLLEDPAFVRTLVFTRTKHGADRVAKSLSQAKIGAHAIHGNKSQGARERALDDFRDGKAHVLVATDIAARGIDVPEITHVINFDLPNIPESYVHRIGRTARAGRAGIAISFCDEGEHEFLRDIEKLIKKRIPVLGGGNDRRGQRPQQPAAPVAPRAARPGGNPWVETGPAVAVAEAESGSYAAPFAEGIDEPARSDDGQQREQREQRELRKQRPEHRRSPGPYAPTPRGERRDGNRGPNRGHDQHHRGPQQHQPQRQGGQGSGRHGQRRSGQDRQGRPAMPNAVDPEQRRQRPAGGDRPPARREPSRGGGHSGGGHSGGGNSGRGHSGGGHSGGGNQQRPGQRPGQRPHGNRRPRR